MEQANTAEKYFKLQALLMLLPLTICVTSVIAMIAEHETGLAVLMAVLFSPVLGAFVFFTYQAIYYRRVELTDIQTVKLDGMRTFGAWNLAGFEIKVVRGGREEYAATKRVFVSGGIINLTPLADYAGKYKRVGYNAKRDEWIVLV